MKNIQDTFLLANGVKIPCVGFGTWRASGDEAYASALHALRLGYRHIDTAAYYDNEKEVGNAVRDSGVAREDIFITSKVWCDDRGYERTKAAFYRTLDALKTDYLDLYLIHWPASPSRFTNWREINLDTWRAMTELYQAGLIRAIGTSNFLVHHLECMTGASVMPMVNQIEYHPGYLQQATVDFCRQNGILVEAWSPLGRTRVFDNPCLLEIASRYGKSVAQICLRFCLQNGVLPLPKSVTPARIEENACVFDFTLSDADMQAICAMGLCGESGRHPDTVEF